MPSPHNSDLQSAKTCVIVLLLLIAFPDLLWICALNGGGEVWGENLTPSLSSPPPPYPLSSAPPPPPRSRSFPPLPPAGDGLDAHGVCRSPLRRTHANVCLIQFGSAAATW